MLKGDMGILDYIYPKRCVGCRRVGGYICQSCALALAPPPAICPGCARPSLGGWVHPRCISHSPLTRLIVGLPYRGHVQSCLKSVKYHYQWDRIRTLFALWRERVADYQLPDFAAGHWVVVAVPMWSAKERRRGFNQASLLARELARHYKVPNLAVLRRRRETTPMYGLSKGERKTNVADAFELRPGVGSLRGSHILLVDDVWTTGATLRSCAQVLKQRGAVVWGVALSR
jgi:ComF family protein